MTHLTIIVAYDTKHGIGINNSLPWRLPEDLAHFKRITTGHAIIMGRKTFESIGRPLPNRRNIVLTRDKNWEHDGVEVANSMSNALELVGESNVFVIGGADIYTQALPVCNQLLVTEIHREFICDAFFPEIDKKVWKEVGRNAHYSERNEFGYAFVTYQRHLE